MCLKKKLEALILEQENSCSNEPVDGWMGDETEEEKAEFDGDVVSLFPDGGESVICTSWADDLVERLGGDRVTLVGYDALDNPDSAVSGVADGHDFAIVDGRYIVDGWVKFVECGLNASGVYDIEDDNDLPEIKRLYGDATTWQPRAHQEAKDCQAVIEKFVDQMAKFGTAQPVR